MEGQWPSLNAPEAGVPLTSSGSRSASIGQVVLVL